MHKNANSNDHTPLPWSATGQSDRDYEGVEIGTANKTVAVMLCVHPSPGNEEQANADLILRSVNNFHDLKEVAERALDALNGDFRELDQDELRHMISNVLVKVNAPIDLPSAG